MNADQEIFKEILKKFIIFKEKAKYNKSKRLGRWLSGQNVSCANMRT